MDSTRRQLLTGIPLIGAGALLVGCRRSQTASGTSTNEKEHTEATADKGDVEVSATEDLMREHGILRRALLVYRESALKMRQDVASVPIDALEKTAQLFRVFGEEYHERKLEESYIFPSLKKSQNSATPYVDFLMTQHARGREITDYILSMTGGDKLPAGTETNFINTLESFVRMYEHHAAVEDTLVFPVWKESISPDEFDELGSKFEEIEEEQFGEDGFKAALTRMAEIEGSLGLANLDMFTAPPPPKRK
ncbi:MAG TPA: hemerythrin domain-containing protein [Pyrinomonadaceae bacterium]